MAEVLQIYLPPAEGGAKQGVDDFLAGHSVEELLSYATCELREPPNDHSEAPEPDTQSASLVRYVEEDELFHSPDGEAYATFTVEGHRETHAVRSKGLRLWLQRRFYEEHGKPPGAQALQDALGVLEAKALFEGKEHEVNVRVAELEGAIYIDLANEAWEAVKITPAGIEIVCDPPVRFRRRKGMLALPHPAIGGNVEALRRFVNLKDAKDWLLLLAWLVQAFRPTSRYPILILQGEQGSAKTTLARMLKAMLDPSTTPVRSVSRGEHDLVIAANNSWVMALDNLSGLPPWLSDALCRLSTGGGFGTRTLYENDEETLFDATRPVILNGITDVATRADLLDRAIILVLPTIPEEERRPEAELWGEFEEALPEILGGIFTAASVALRELAGVELDSLPRMADFAKWATAAETALGMGPGKFMEAYAGRRQEISEMALEADPVAVAVVQLMADKDKWVGTAMELLKELGTRVDEDVRRYKTWPKLPNHLSRHLNRLAPVLRAKGIEVEDLPRTGEERKKRLSKNKPANERHDRHDRHDGEEADRKATSTHDGDDDDMTLRADEGANDPHGANPIEKPNSPSHDGDDAHDDEMQHDSKLSSVVIQEASPVTGAKADYELINDQTRLGELIADIEKSASIGLDLETTGLRWWEDKIRILSITTQSGRTWLVDVFKVDIRLLLPALENTKIIAHNAQFDLLFLRRAGFEPGECSCTMILSQILWAGLNVNEKFHGLQTLVKRVLGRTLDKDQQTADWSEELSPEMLNYAAEDSRVLLPLYEELVRLVKEAGGMERVVELEERLLKAVVSMADAGVPIDREAWSEYVELVRREKERLIREMDSHVTESLPEEYRELNAKNKQIPQDRKEKVNWQSSKQRAWALEGLGFVLPLTENGNPSSGKDALKKFDHPLAGLMERFNAIRNAAKTFGEALTDRAEGDRLHCDWRQNEATTGRMSCRKPPLQGVPSAGKLREAIKAPAGHKLVVSDLSQIEVRVLAALSRDETLKGAFEKGLDIHLSVAERILGREVTNRERKIAKAIVFGNMYGQGVEGMRRKVENDLGRAFPYEEAEKYWRGFFDAYPGVKRWREEVAWEFDLGERETRTRTGRRRIEVDEKPKRWNTPIQGLAADALKAITVEVHERRQEVPGLQLVALVHDEVICLVPEEHAERAAEWLTDIMETAADTIVNVDAPTEARVPMKADTKVCGTWADQSLKTNERSSKVMYDKWRDEDAEAQYECEDESVNLQLYSDHRRGDLDSYPIIAVCDECAAELGGELGGCAGPAGHVQFCEECGISVDNTTDMR